MDKIEQIGESVNLIITPGIIPNQYVIMHNSIEPTYTFLQNIQRLKARLHKEGKKITPYSRLTEDIFVAIIT